MLFDTLTVKPVQRVRSIRGSASVHIIYIMHKFIKHF